MKKFTALLIVMLLCLSAVSAQATSCTCACAIGSSATGAVESTAAGNAQTVYETDTSESAFTGNAQLVYEAVKWCADIPKNAQVISALDYICNMTDDIKAHYMLIQVTQDQNIINICGTGAQIIMIDLDTNEVYSYNDLVFPDNFDIANADDARNVLYNAYDSYLQGWSDSIWMPVEEIISPMAEEEISQINSALSAHFTK